MDSTNLEILSSRTGFNSAVRHIKKTLEITGGASNGNLADILYELGDDQLTGDRIGLLLRMLLIDKLGYKACSSNLSAVVEKPSKLAKEFEKWKGVDLVAAYYHPDIGLLIANPKTVEGLESFGQLRKQELMVIYAGMQGREAGDECQKAAELALKLFEGSKVTAPAVLTRGNFTVRKLSKPVVKKEAAPAGKKAVKKITAKKAKPDSQKAAAPEAPAKAAAPSAGPKRMTPRYSVVVQNELFHNGNVEAWKKIVASYRAKYPLLEVYIYYENERILDINSLFKWGKVKHGTAIEFAIAGNDIRDVAKLQRYLAQGASHMFEAFLRGPVNTVLKLF